MSKPKLSDVWWMTATMLPVTKCEPPEGGKCYLQRGSSAFSAADAKRHALKNPGHLVTREAVTRTQYHLEPEDHSAETGTGVGEAAGADTPTAAGVPVPADTPATNPGLTGLLDYVSARLDDPEVTS